MIFAAVLAGGIGSRMGNPDLPKQYMEIGGTPIIIRSVEKFTCRVDIEHVLVLTPESWVEYTKKLIVDKCTGAEKVSVISGGETRNDTLYNAVCFFDEKYGLDDETVLITHDAVRPFITQRIIEDNIQAAINHGACGTAVPSTDTILVSRTGDSIDSIPDRSELYSMQTPQTFKAAELKALMESLTEDEAKTLTDGCKILLMKGKPVYIVAGETYNIKITYPSDIDFGEAFIRNQK